MFFLIYKNRSQCVENPLIYAAEKGSSKDNDLMCNCYFTDLTYAPFSFNKEGIYIGTTFQEKLYK